MANFLNETIQSVWEKGKVVEGYDSTKFRKDTCGAWMKRSEYGNRDSIYGWEIDHIVPVSQGGLDRLSNFRPLQWYNNASRQNGRLTIAVKAIGNRNFIVE